MISRKRLLSGSALYVIVDRGILNLKDCIAAAEAAIIAGADMVQLRDKESSPKEMLKAARAIGHIAKRHKVPFIINDRLDVALAVDADGVHIGQGDVDISLAKKLLGKDKLIGLSVSDIGQAKKAKREGASYVGAGPIFKTPIKGHRPAKGVRLLEDIKRLNIPFFAIGGITGKNISRLTDKGFKRIAVIRAVCESGDRFKATKLLKKALV